MPTVNNLTVQQLENPAVFEKVKKLALEIVSFLETPRALALINQLKISVAKLKNSQSSKIGDYQELLTLLKWSAFSSIPEEDCLMLLRNQILPAVKNNLDIKSLVESRLFVYPLIARKEVVKNFRQKLEENNEVIGKQKIKDWIALYNQYEDFTKRNNLSLLNFFNQSQKAQILTEEERNILREILNLYDKDLLKAPVADQETLAEIIRTTPTTEPPLRTAPTTPEKRPKIQAFPQTGNQEPKKRVLQQPPKPLNQDRYREPISQEDVLNKYKIPKLQSRTGQAPLQEPEETVVNPLNIVDLREEKNKPEQD